MPKASTIVNFIMQRAIFFIALMLLWYVCYPNVLRSMEETAFWTDAPDMCNVMYHWPADWAKILSNYLAQYFIIPFWGASLMALLPLVVLLCADVVIWQLFRCRRLQCFAFIPGVVVAGLFVADGTLSRMLTVDLIAVVCALIVTICTLWRPLYRVTFNSKFWLTVTNLTPYILLIIMCLAVKTDNVLHSREFTQKIEHMAADSQWKDLFDLTYAERQKLDDNQTAYALLAASKVGELPNRLFHYNVKGLENIFAHNKNFRFNSFFCHELGLPNEAVRYAFEEGQYMPAGASFGTMRRMVDWLLEKGDDPQMVQFYMNILSHSSCHQNFIKTRSIFMNQEAMIKDEYEPEFVGSPSFLYESALTIERDPKNTRARDYLLCGMLLMGNNDAFMDLFERLYVETNDTRIPLHYLEALAMLQKTHPGIESSYNLPVKLVTNYQDFLSLASQGEQGKQRALKKYYDTYWAYLLRRDMASKQKAELVEELPTTTPIGPEFGY